MRKLSFAVGLLAALTTSAMAQQTIQSQQTGKTGVIGGNATINNGMTSTNSGSMTGSGIRDTTTGTASTGTASSRLDRDSPVVAPKATTGNGQPSNNEAPRK
jgi:hypothetical protein